MKTTVKVSSMRTSKIIPGDEVHQCGVYRMEKSSQSEYVGHLYVYSTSVCKFISLNHPGESRSKNETDHYIQVKSMHITDVEFA